MLKFAGCVAKQCISTVGSVGVAGCIGKQRTNTVSCVRAAARVPGHRKSAAGRVVVAVSVALQRRNAAGRIVAAACVAKQRLKATGCVLDSSCQTEERIVTLGRFWPDSRRPVVGQRLAQLAQAPGSPVRIEIIELFFLAESMDSWFFLSFPRCVISLALPVRIRRRT